MNKIMFILGVIGVALFCVGDKEYRFNVGKQPVERKIESNKPMQIREIIKVKDGDAADTAKKLAREEGIFAGISSGAAMWAALEVGKRKDSNGKNLVVILPDTGERYLSTWLYEEFK